MQSSYTEKIFIVNRQYLHVGSYNELYADIFMGLLPISIFSKLKKFTQKFL